MRINVNVFPLNSLSVVVWLLLGGGNWIATIIPAYISMQLSTLDYIRLQTINKK
jgi:hypothetical protein